MIILDDTTKSLQIRLGSLVTTNEISFMSSWVDGTVTTYTPVSADGETAGTTWVTLVPAPAAATQRQLKQLVVRNADTQNASVELAVKVGANRRVILTLELIPGSHLSYDDGVGFRTLDAGGAILQSAAAGSIWYSGSGTPSVFLGVNNDKYLRSDTYDIYGKTGGAWVNSGINLRGPAGSPLDLGPTDVIEVEHLEVTDLANPNVTILTTPVTGNVLRYDGTNWRNVRNPSQNARRMFVAACM